MKGKMAVCILGCPMGSRFYFEGQEQHCHQPEDYIIQDAILRWGYKGQKSRSRRGLQGLGN